MKQNKTHSLIVVLVFLVLVFNVFILPAYAIKKPFNTSNLFPKSQGEVKPTPTTDLFTVDLESSIPIERPTRSLGSKDSSTHSNLSYSVNGSIFSYTTSLTSTNLTDYYFFSVPQDKNILLNLQSSNPNYRVVLYRVNYSLGQAYPTNIGTTSGHFAFNNTTDPNNPNDPNSPNRFHAGDWLLVVNSTGTVGNSYTINLNVSGPPLALTPTISSLASQSVVWPYPNGDLYLNDTYIANTKNVNPHLDWKREFYFSSGGSYSSRSHDISEVRVSSTAIPEIIHQFYALRTFPL